MTETEILGLKKPGANDFYSVDDFNHNMDKLEAMAATEKAREAKLIVTAPVGCVVRVWHASGSQSEAASTHSDFASHSMSSTATYAYFTFPYGGPVIIDYLVDGVRKKSIEDNLTDGQRLTVMQSDCFTIYKSELACIPSGTFAEGGACEKCSAWTFINQKNELKIANKRILTFDYFEDLYEGTANDSDRRVDVKQDLWHAVRIGLLTQEQYTTITGDTYPEFPVARTANIPIF